MQPLAALRQQTGGEQCTARRPACCSGEAQQIAALRMRAPRLTLAAAPHRLLQVRPTQFGVVDNRTLFVAFEGRATGHTPLFKGVDLFYFNDSATKITEIEGGLPREERRRSVALLSWLPCRSSCELARGLQIM